ncbi:MAG: acyl-ACP--UDP-N-acetylglucosamine O-acyltransferase [Proteobacteria bacterium]|nr:acyl-ACP--UDP-N-acetylglucosamine O-acyltransferase [Pseudomonadota bacterium]
MNIHPTALVADSAVLADDVEVGPYAIIGDHVEISAGSRIESHVVVNGPTRIGENNHIYQFSSIGDDPQDMKYAGEPTRLEIGAGNTIREYCTISRGTVQDASLTTMGDDNWIMAYVHIAHDCVIGDHTIFANCTTLGGHVMVGDHAIFGGFSGVHQFCQIGVHSFMAMYSVVARDVPAYLIVSGNPVRPRGVNKEGLKRRGFDRDQLRQLRAAYRLIYREGLKLADAIVELELRLEAEPVLLPLVESLKSSTRGIAR